MATPKNVGEGKLFLSLFAFFTALAMIPAINIVALENPVADSMRALVTLPVWFCIAFTLRSLFANDLSFKLIEKHVNPHFSGIANSALSVLVNVFIMAPIMCAFGTAFGVAFSGADWSTFGLSYLTMLPKAAVIAWLLVFFIARPLACLVFSGVLKPLQESQSRC